MYLEPVTAVERRLKGIRSHRHIKTPSGHNWKSSELNSDPNHRDAIDSLFCSDFLFAADLPEALLTVPKASVRLTDLI